jgi:transposase IS66 family protein
VRKIIYVIGLHPQLPHLQRHLAGRGLQFAVVAARPLAAPGRQAERYAREGVPLSLSTLADKVGTWCSVLWPLHGRLLSHVLAAERLHGDDTIVPVLAKGKTVTGRCWTYVRDDRPFGGQAPPAAVFFHSRDRSGEYPQQHLALERHPAGRRL